MSKPRSPKVRASAAEPKKSDLRQGVSDRDRDPDFDRDRVGDRDPDRDGPANALSLPIGPRVLEILDVAYRARRPVLLEGTTGIGKSQIVGEFAATNGLGLVVLDLSLLEPPDLVGLPMIRDGKTHYASPAELPTIGRGILMLEELNRAEIPVMQPALQLLSARRLHAYELPPGWICVAAVNPEDGDYQVNRLDPALRSRFLQLSVCADRDTWLQWATRHNVHPVVLRIVADHDDAFEQTSPRSWAYASDVLHVLGPEEIQRPDLVRATLRGYLPAAWAMVLTNAIAAYPSTPALDADALFTGGGPEMLAALVKQLTDDKRIDGVTMVASRVRHALSRDAWAADALAGTVTLDQLERLVASLPGDLRDQCLETAVESRAASGLLKGLDIFPSRVIEGYDGSKARALMQEWRQSAQLHRVRLVVVGVLRWLRAQPEGGAIAKDKRRSRQLELLIEDAGSAMGHDLDRWLRARASSLANAST